MSNFLFRLVDRASGAGAESRPQPPTPIFFPDSWPGVAAEFDAPAPTVANSDALPSATLPTFPSPPKQGDVVRPVTRPEPLAVPTVDAAPVRQSETEPAVSHSVEAEAQKGDQPPVVVAVQSEYVESNHREVEPVAPAVSAKPTPSARPKTIVTSALPPAREQVHASAKPQAPVPEPDVEVRIGRVEVRFDAPTVNAAPQQNIKPAGFAEYAALRRYAIHSWRS